jgi:hypothetical protein
LLPLLDLEPRANEDEAPLEILTRRIRVSVEIIIVDIQIDVSVHQIVGAEPDSDVYVGAVDPLETVFDDRNACLKQ